ncbi:GlsB/YeaQ/YmgE family stress response membrane protein [Candidatus Daviesbacteria bacterium]|nr:GlsB/YeaQ/YmgE family stress response membrane protein [Candidatus Daviesbacteria bacterium]
MNFLSWALFGVLIGLIVHVSTPTSSRDSLIGAIILGVLGAFVGGLLGDIIFGINIEEFNLLSFIVAALGSMIILIASKSARKL